MKRYKIIHVLKGKANPDSMNGVNKVVHHLATTQLQQGFDVEVWGITGSPECVKHEHEYPLKLFMGRKNRFSNPKQIKKALSETDDNSIFHLHSVFLPEHYAFSKQLKALDRPWVVSPHGGYAPESMKKNSLMKKVYKCFFESQVVNGAAAIHAIGRFGEADQFKVGSNASKVKVVPNGHDVTNQYKERWSLSGPLRLVFCGRLAMKHKGLDLLLKGLKMAIQQGVDLYLDFIGDGPDRNALKEMVCDLQLNDFVHFHGALFGQDKIQVLLNAEAFVHSSRWDGIPLAVLEAAGLGLPLIVSEPTNMTDSVEKFSAGYLIERLDPQVIANVLTAVANDKIKGRLSEKGHSSREMIINHFSWENISRDMSKKIYDPIMVARKCN